MSANRQRIIAFIRLSRLHFLMGGFLMFAIGAFASDPPGWKLYLLAQLMVTTAQLTAHYVNEHADFEADSQIQNRTNFSGGSGILQSGVLPKSIALNAAFVTSAICVLSAIAISIHYPLAAVLCTVALVISWAYSMPPVRLLSTGSGELFTSITVAVLVPAIGSEIATHHVPHQLAWSVAALVSLHMAMLLAFEIPDLATDEAAGKRVLGVRVGTANTRLLIVTFNLLAELIAFGGWLLGQMSLGAFVATLVVLPLIAVSAYLVHTSRYALLTFTSVATFFLTGAGYLAVELQKGSL